VSTFVLFFALVAAMTNCLRCLQVVFPRSLPELLTRITVKSSFPIWCWSRRCSGYC